jgi:uncharacterized membrane protein
MKTIRSLCGPFFIFAGTMHFVTPRFYKRIMPPYLPAHDFLVAASGVAEIAGGVGIMVPPLRRRAGWWLLATLAGVYPANIHMAMHPEQYPEVPGGAAALKARLPIQGIFAAWVIAAMRDR